MIAFLSGAFALAATAVALFFFEYWKKTKDRLFVILALAFVLLALERTLLAFVPSASAHRHWIFGLRLAAFAAIIAGIVEKNRHRHRCEQRMP